MNFTHENSNYLNQVYLKKIAMHRYRTRFVIDLDIQRPIVSAFPEHCSLPTYESTNSSRPHSIFVAKAFSSGAFSLRALKSSRGKILSVFHRKDPTPNIV